MRDHSGCRGRIGKAHATARTRRAPVNDREAIRRSGTAWETAGNGQECADPVVREKAGDGRTGSGPPTVHSATVGAAPGAGRIVQESHACVV